jgi:hypothetical protein
MAYRGDKTVAYRGLGGRPQEKKHLEDLKDNVEMDPQKVGCGGMNWVGLAQDRDRWWELVDMVMNLRFTKNAGNS